MNIGSVLKKRLLIHWKGKEHHITKGKRLG